VQPQDLAKNYVMLHEQPKSAWTFDFGNPTAFLAHLELKKLAEKYDAELIYEPFLLAAVHKATNNMPPGMVSAKGRYMFMDDLPRFVKRYNVAFKMNPFFPINMLQLMRGCYAAKEMDLRPQSLNKSVQSRDQRFTLLYAGIGKTQY